MINTPRFFSEPQTYEVPLSQAKALPARLNDPDIEHITTSDCEAEPSQAATRSAGRPRIPLPRGLVSESDIKNFRRRAANRGSAQRMRANKNKRVAELESEVARLTKANEQLRSQSAAVYIQFIALHQAVAQAVKFSSPIATKQSTTDDSVFEPPGLDAKTFAEMASDYGLL